MRRQWRRLTLVLMLAFGLGVVAWLSSSQLSLTEFAQQEQSLRDLITAHPAASWVTGFVLYWIASLVPGTRGKAIVCGWLFGFWPALLLVNLALTLAALCTFFVSRYLFRDAVESRYGTRLAWLNKVLEREGAWYVILIRILPLSFSLPNYLLGATKIRARTFWWATHIGLLPGNAVFVLVGSQLPTLTDLSTDGIAALLSWRVIAGLAALSLFPLLVHRLVSIWRTRSAAEETSGTMRHQA